jgi:hypothetical protein
MPRSITHFAIPAFALFVAVASVYRGEIVAAAFALMLGGGWVLIAWRW